jgi:hypothetical protein
VASRLAELQAALQGDIMRGETTSLSRLSVPASVSPAARLHVYQHAYVARLTEILGEDYDTTWSFLGDENFHELTVDYVRDYPSHTRNARWFGHRFPDFLASHPKLAAVPAVAEIAGLERALADAFDAPDAAVVTHDDLAAIGAGNVEDLLFVLHPSVAVLGLATNAYDIFNALRGDAPLPAPRTRDDKAWVVVWRPDLTCRHAALGREEGILLDHVRQGYDFARLCEVSAMTGDADTAAARMAGYVRNWIALGLISGLGCGRT